MLGHIAWLWSDDMNNHTALGKAPNADRAQYVWSSSSMINIAVTTLFIIQYNAEKIKSKPSAAVAMHAAGKKIVS